MNKSYFNWDSDLITGIESIDSEHKALIEIINEVLQLCFNTKDISLERLNEIHNELSTYVVQHFNNEETLMKINTVDIRHIRAHALAHLEFKKKIAFYFSDLTALKSPEKLSDISEYLIRWLAYHILNMDKSLVRQIDYIKSNQVSPSEAYENEKNMTEGATEPLLKALKSLFYLVSEKNTELELANSDLEKKIEMRTIELWEINKRLEDISLQDELTGLFNRRFAIIEINKLIENFKRYGTPFSVLYIDLDKFKYVNDTFGHGIGDQVLNWISNYFLSNVRKTDLVCRLGGDEFIIVCNQCRVEEALKLSSKLLLQLEHFVNVEIGKYWVPSFSVGCTEVDAECETASCVLNKADHMMYLTKKSSDR